MKIAIIVAMDKELSLLLPLLGDATTSILGDKTIHHGHVGPHEVTISKCGIGKVNAALAANALIDAFSPDLVINSGVAGGTGGGAGVLDVVVGERVAYHDTWCGPGTVEGEADGCPRYFTPPAALLGLPSLASARRGLVCSGDRFIASAAEIEAIRANFPDVMAVDMESAAIAHACHRRGVDFLCLRVVSDTPGEHDDNAMQYTDFWEQAPRSTFNAITALLNEIK